MKEQFGWLEMLGAFALGMAVGAMLCVPLYRKHAIAHGCAGYNQTTGKFEWRNGK